MWLKIICIISIVSANIKSLNSIPIAELNETNLYLLISSQLTDIKTELNRLTEKPNQHQVKPYGSNCAEATVDSKTRGIYEILVPSYSKQPFKVTSDATTQGASWTLILKRMDGSENFYKNWNAYKNGFGDLDGEFFLGLDKIHALTAEKSQELLVILEDFDGKIANVTYERFRISGEEEQYAINTLGKAKGTAGDSLRYHFGMKFTTFDRDNDKFPNENCAKDRTGAWWYNGCTQSNLGGTYNATICNRGVTWDNFRKCEYSLKKAVMMIRPRIKI